MLFLPLLPSLQNISTESVHPHKVPVSVLLHGKPLYLSPAVRLEGSTALAEPGRSSLAAKAWVVPFWVIRRVTDKKLCNCTLAEIAVDTIHTGGIGGEHLNVEDARLVFGSQLKLPVITNLVPLAKDSELLLYQEPAAKTKKNKAKSAPPRKRAKVDDKADDVK